jgi:hypothetical protein
MSDFYQILKREIEPDNSPLSDPDKEAVVLIKKLPVENSANKTGEAVIKKTRFAPRKKNVVVKKENGKLPKKLRAKKEKSSRAKASSFVLPSGTSADKSEDGSGSEFLSHDASNPIWLTMAEAAKLGGIQKRTIKRAVRAGAIRYRIVESRYQVDLRATLLYFLSKKKLWNKLNEFGIGQYIEEWKE